MVQFGFSEFDPDGFTDGMRPPRDNDAIAAELRIGTRPTGSAPGRAAGALEGMARPHLGWLATLADLVMGTAYSASLGEGWTCLTVSLRIDAIGSIAPDIPIDGYGVVDRQDRPDGVLQSLMLQKGRPVATAVGRFIPLGKPPRPVPDRIVSFQEAGVDLADGFGMRARWQPDVDVELSADETIANPSGVAHGGLQVAIGAEAIVRSIAEYDASTHRITDLSTRFLAPTPTGPGQRLVVRVRRVHTGRSARTARAELIASDGTLASIVEATVATIREGEGSPR